MKLELLKKIELRLLENGIAIRNSIYFTITFLLCAITLTVFCSKVTVVEDVIVGLFSQVTPLGTLYSMDQANHMDNEFAGVIAFLLPTVQEIQIVTVMDKILDHHGLYNRILNWFSTLFLTLFLGFTIEIYSEINLMYIFMACVLLLAIYSLVLVIRKTHNILWGIILFLGEFYFINPVSRYLWAYGIGWFISMMGFAIILEILNMIGLHILVYVLIFVLTPWVVQAEAWIVEKLLKVFFGDLYDSEEICMLDKIGLAVSGGFLVIWILMVIIF